MSLEFENALPHIKNGIRMSRLSWSEGTFVVGMPALKLPAFSCQEAGPKVNDRTAKHIGGDTPLDSQPYLVSFDGVKWQPGWLPSQADLFASDWFSF